MYEIISVIVELDNCIHFVEQSIINTYHSMTKHDFF